MNLRVALPCAALLLALPASGAAQTEPGRVELVLVTEVPQYLGGGLSVGLGRRVRVQSTAGASVTPYVSAVHAVVAAGASLDASLQAPLRAAVQDFVVWRTHAVWQPSPRLGLELGAGYGLFVVRGDVSNEVTVALSHARMPTSSSMVPPPYVIRAWLHQADVEVAWRIPLYPSLSLRVALGVGVTAYASTSVSSRYNVGTSDEARAQLAVSEAVVTDWLTRWRVLPGLSIALHLTI